MCACVPGTVDTNPCLCQFCLQSVVTGLKDLGLGPTCVQHTVKELWLLTSVKEWGGSRLEQVRV